LLCIKTAETGFWFANLVHFRSCCVSVAKIGIGCLSAAGMPGLFHFFAKKNAQTFAQAKSTRIFAVPNEKGISKTFKIFLSG
jgi:hypothetical protein